MRANFSEINRHVRRIRYLSIRLRYTQMYDNNNRPFLADNNLQVRNRYRHKIIVDFIKTRRGNNHNLSPLARFFELG